MKKLYFNSKANNLFFGYFSIAFLLLGISLTTTAQLRVPFTQRTSQYTPTKKIYNVKGNFAMIGNTNLTLQNYGNGTNNNNNVSVYVDIDGTTNGFDGKPTFNSSSANLTLSTENGAVPSCSNIIYAGLYWTGKTTLDNTSAGSPEAFSKTKVIEGVSVTKNFNKRNISFKGPNATVYTQFTASTNNIYYPNTNDAYIYSAYTEVTDYVRENGIGAYTAADIALSEGNGGGTGFSGGWGMIVVYENSKMKYRDVTIFDGHAFVLSSNTTGFTLPVSGFNTVQSGNVGIKIGLMASEGDVGLLNDYFQIQRNSDSSYLNLSHSLNLSTNFFNSSINTGGNIRNPNLQNNTGIDISTFDIPNSNNSVIGNNQTSTNFKYGTGGDTYAIFAMAMAVDAYIPEVENILTATTINNVPVTSEPYITLPGQDVGFNIDIKNLGTEAINNYKVVVPIPYNASYVPGSAVGTILFTPVPEPNQVTFEPTLGATGSIVWNIGTLPLGVNPSTLLAKLSFKLKSTTDCSILLNPTCGSPIFVTASSSGAGAITGTIFTGTRAIKGYTNNGNCTGQPIMETLAIGINGTSYVAENCQNTPLIRNFGFCNTASTIGTSAISANFPPGSTFYNEFPVTINSTQYSDSNPFPLVAGSTTTYYALPPNTTGCFFPFTISKCRVIDAVNDSIGPINGTTGSTNAGNIFNNNGSGIDTLGGSLVLIAQVNLTVLTPATPIGGGFIPSIDLLTGNIIVPAGTPAGVYTIVYQICEKITPTNCDSATVTICVSAAPISGGDQVVCKTSPTQTLTATALAPGQTIVWYNALTGGSIVASPTLNTVGSITYYAQANVGSCSFPTRTAVTLTINPTAAIPVSGGNQTQCEASPLQTLTATATAPAGQTIVWYNAASNGSIVTSPTLNTVGTVTYYAQAMNGSNCASLTRTPVTLTINAAPVAPVSGGNQTQCEASPSQTLTATATVPGGQTIVWYSAASNGSIVTSPTLNTVGTVTYYAQAVNGTNCASLTRTAVSLTINAASVTPVSGGNQTQCEASPLQTLTATAASEQAIVWYNAASNGSIVTNPTLNTVGTVTYYAQAVNGNNCASLTRTPVTLTINAAPVAPVSSGNQTQCEASPLQTLTANATAAGQTIVWFNAATDGSIVASPTLNTIGTITYYAQTVNADNCASLTKTPVTLTINAASVVPVSGGNQTQCEASPLQTLTASATAPAGQTIVWYNAASNGSIVASPTLNTVGTITYYAQAVNGNNCTSLTRTAVTLTINAAPVVPVSGGNQTQCEASPLQTLTATATAPAGQTIVWYNAASNGSIVTSPTLNTVGTITYYAQAVNANDCSSLTRTPVTLTINAAPVVPVSGGNQTQCEASPLQTLTATATVPGGQAVVWYDAATNGNVLVTAPTLNVLGSITYYAQAVNAGNCASLTRTPVTLTINAAPVVPVSGGNQTQCEASPLQTLTATATVPAGQTVVWYDAATNGNVLVTAPTLNAVGSITYYAQAVNAGNCASLTRTPVTLTINAAPVVPVSGGNQTQCEASPLQTLTATATVPAGQTVVWYDAATNGNVLVTAPTLNVLGSITYYAQAVNAGNCASLTRTAITLTINAAPVVPVSGGNQTQCEASPIQTLTATATVPAGQTVVWYDAATNGNVLVTAPTLNAVGSITYYAQAVNANDCSSLTRTPVTLTINAAPVVPISGGNQTQCEASPLQTLTATATVPGGQAVVWYDAASGGNVLVTAPTLNAVGSITYYAQAVNASDCSSLTRTAVTLTINAAPVAPISGGNQTQCEASPLQTLTATATVPGGQAVVWYDAATGGTIVTAPTLNAIGTVTYFAAADGGTCLSLERTPVTLTINAAPVAPISGGNQTQCEASPLQTLTATATVPGGQAVVWYDAATGGNVLVTAPTLNAVGSITYYAQALNANDCSSLTRTAVTLTINAAPVAPVSGGNQTQCEASPLQTLTATATVPVGQTVIWYDAATGGTIVTAPTLNAVGTVTYFAAADGGTCISLERTPVTLTINAAPVAPISGGNQTQCEASPFQTLTATATVPAGQAVVWYDATSNGSIVTSPTLNAVGSITYYAQAVNANDCSSLTRTPVTLTINAAPVAPISGGNQTECEASPLQTLTATATVPAGQAVVWYDSAIGGNVLVTAPTLNAVGSITYYAQAVNANDCSSLTRTAVTLTINAAPVAPISGGNQTECEASPLQTLTATATVPAGQAVVWYDAATNGNVLVTAPTLNAVGSITYYAQAVNANDCSSLTRTPVTLTINAAPVAPISGGNQTECEASPLQTLTATATVPGGQAVVWYDAASGGNVIVTAPTLNAVGSITYYAQAVNANDCSSLTRTSITLTINAAPVAPISGGNQTECEASPLQTLTATAIVPAGQAVVWYDAATGGNVLVTAPTLNAVGSITYYAQAVNANDCSSLTRTPVTLTINAAPVAPISGGNQTECEASPLQTLTATATVSAGQAVVWYDAPTGGNVLVTAPTLNTVGSVTYYAQAVNANDCSSLTRTAVTLTINAAPVAPISGGNQTECEASPLQTLTATATVPVGQTVVWYDAATGGSIVIAPTLNAVGTVTYFAAADGGTCISLERTPVTLTINAAPVAPITGGDQTECEASPLQTLTATATVPAGQAVVWYNAASGGNVLVTAPTLNAVGSVTYYAQAVGANDCSSLTRTPVTLTINAAPVAPISGGNQTECEASPLQTLTATATVPVGQTVVWYDAATGGSIVIAPTLNAIGTVTYFAAADGGTCISLERTPVTLTINAAPVAPISGGDQTECEASPLQTLTATATVPAGQAVVWYNAATGGNVLVTAPTLNAVGSITYFAQAVDANNCSSLTRTAVTLTINPAPIAAITGGDQTECEASPLQTLTATATVPAGQTVVWYDAATAGSIVIAPTLSSVGTVIYYAQATSAENCASLTRTAVTLTIKPLIAVPLTGTVTNPTCTVANGSFSISNFNINNTYSFTPTAGVSVSSTGIVTAPTGTYVITASSNGCTSGNSVSVTIDSQPETPTAVIVGTVIQPTCANATGSVVLSGLPAGNWNINPGNISGTTSFTTISDLSPGTYNFTVTNNAGCTSGTSNTVIIDAQPETPAAPVLGTVTGPTCTVTTGSVVLSDLPAGSWIINPGSINGNGTTITISDLAPGTYTYTVTNSVGCTSVASANVVINEVTANPTIVVNSSAADCNNDDDVEFDLNTFLPTGTTLTGIWSTENASANGGLIGSVFSPYLIEVGTYLFTYNAIDDGGCAVKVDLNMTVDDECEVLSECTDPFVHNAFSPNGDTVNEIFVIDQLEQVDCFPTNTVEIYNRWGVLVYETNQYNNNTRVFTGKSEGRVTVDKGAQLPTGTYFYVLNYTTKEGETKHKEGYLFLNQ